ncbi:hypothetical protein [Archangium sp.]|jgi:hypothetical protein|uniref:hypothetical protein n=1 Tax=Archangium sp. TaxID=1872627 RepID=UPI002ED9F790
MRALCFVVLLFVSSVALAAEGTTVTVRCRESCSVLLEGKSGRRVSDSQWEFKEVPAGRRRIEIKGALGLPKVSSYVDIPEAPEATVYMDSRLRLGVSPGPSSSTPPEGGTTKPAAPPERKKDDTSRLHLRCHKPCTVTMDYARRVSGTSSALTLHEVTPGRHRLDVSFGLGNKDQHGFIDVPAASEVFVQVSDAGLQVSNTKPLGR